MRPEPRLFLKERRGTLQPVLRVSSRDQEGTTCTLYHCCSGCRRPAGKATSATAPDRLDQSAAPMGVRRIRPNHRSVTGFVPSKKNPGVIAFESTLERDAILLLEYDPAVRSIAAQPLRIVYENGSYTPDFYVEFQANGQREPLVIEVKYRDDLFKNWGELHPKFRAATRHARNNNEQFAIWTEREIRTVRLQSIKDLWRFRNVDVRPDLRDHLFRILADSGSMTVQGLLSSACVDSAERLKVNRAIWHLIASSQILCNLDTARVGLQSVIKFNASI